MTIAPGFLGVLQWIGIVLLAIGLSPAPWVTALLAGRLIPSSWVKKQLDAADKETDTWKGVADRQTERADAAVTALAQLANEQGATTVHLLRSLPQRSKLAPNSSEDGDDHEHR